MKKAAYLAMESNDGWSVDADLAFPPMVELGWEVTSLAWRTAAPDWNAFDAVYIGTPWDYPDATQQFMDLLRQIHHSNAVLVNDFSLVEWTIAKTYLRDLAERGAEIVPTLWFESCHGFSPDSVLNHFTANSIIVKPVISTNASHTYLLHRADAEAGLPDLQSVFRSRPFMAQPFVENIKTEGEFSLFYFSGEFSHAIQKIPGANDFRVQEEHGADIRAVQAEAALVACGDRVLSLVDPLPVYARVDFVRGSHGRFLLMELELIEPSMYLRMDVAAPRRFAKAFDTYVSAMKRGSSQ